MCHFAIKNENYTFPFEGVRNVIRVDNKRKIMKKHGNTVNVTVENLFLKSILFRYLI